MKAAAVIHMLSLRNFKTELYTGSRKPKCRRIGGGLPAPRGRSWSGAGLAYIYIYVYRYTCKYQKYIHMPKRVNKASARLVR